MDITINDVRAMVGRGSRETARLVAMIRVAKAEQRYDRSLDNAKRAQERAERREMQLDRERENLDILTAPSTSFREAFRAEHGFGPTHAAALLNK
jgi:hypothetical protein